MRQPLAGLLLLGIVMLLPAGCGSAPSSGTPPEAMSPTGTETPSAATAGSGVGATEVVLTGIWGPDGIGFDSKGILYVGSRSDNSIYKVTPDGPATQWVTIEGEETLCFALDAADQLYVATKDRLVRVTPDGVATVLADGFAGADDLRLDATGDIWLTDAFRGEVWRVTPEGEKRLFYDSGLEERPRTWYFTGIELDPSYQKVYLTNMDAGQVLAIPVLPDGSAGEPVILAEGLSRPDHLVIDTKGNLYVTTFQGRELIRLAPDGSQQVIASGAQIWSTPSGLVFGRGPGFDPESVYVADYMGSKVIRVYVGVAGPGGDTGR